MHHIFCDTEKINIDSKKIVVESKSENYNHLSNVLRVKEGEEVLVSSNSDAVFDFLCKVEAVNSNEILLVIKEECTKRELPIYISLIIGLPKADKLEFVIDCCTELGVSEFIPCEMTNCVVKVDENKKEKKLQRYKKIALSAAEQSKRGKVPVIREICSYKEALELVKDYEHKFLFYEESKTKFILELEEIKNENRVAVLIGPEGGFTKEEVECAEKKGFKILSLGERILRTEVASLSAISVIMSHFA